MGGRAGHGRAGGDIAGPERASDKKIGAPEGAPSGNQIFDAGGGRSGSLSASCIAETHEAETEDGQRAGLRNLRGVEHDVVDRVEKRYVRARSVAERHTRHQFIADEAQELVVSIVHVRDDRNRAEQPAHGKNVEVGRETALAAGVVVAEPQPH